MDPWLAAGAALVPAAGLYAASCVAEIRGPHDWLYPGAVRRTSLPHAVLTFDDGPDPEKTPRILDALAAAGAKAVFFVIGERAQRHPGIVRRIAAEGHEIGNHSWSHPCLVWKGGRRIADEIDRCQAAVADAAGAPPRRARPPYGLKDWRYYRVLRDRGLTPVLWSRNSRDYWGSSPAVLVKRLSRARPGDVILCHDGDPLAPGTPEAVEAWLKTRPALGGFERQGS